MTNNKLALTNNELTITSLGQIFAQSGYFQDATQAAQAVVKILAGQELGLPPIASMTGINIIKGKVSLSAVAMATILKRHGDYDYRVKRNDDKGCEIEFFCKGESLGISKFTVEDAKQAQLFDKQPNYKKYPRNMLFARAMSNGIRWYCPEVLGGPAYTPGELELETETAADDGNIVEGEVIDFEQQINDFANRLQEFGEAKALAIKLAANHSGMPLPIVAGKILPELQKEYPDFGLDDVKEMLKNANKQP